MAEAELHKERLQALAEKRKRQAEIQDKRRQMDDLILQLQHLKSKAMREQWLLQGTSAVKLEEEELRKKEADQDELKVKKLEDTLQRLERTIELLEHEESEFSTKEQILREKLHEMEKDPLVDLIHPCLFLSFHIQCFYIAGQRFVSSEVMLAENGLLAGMSSQTVNKELKSSNMSEDATELNSEVKSSMDLEASAPVIPSEKQENFHSASAVATMRNINEILDTEVAEEILYLDEVLEASCSDPMTHANSSGSSTEIKSICMESARPSVNVTGMQPPYNKIFPEEKHQPTFIIDDGIEKSSDYSGVAEQNLKRLPEELSAAAFKKEAHFELRPYQEEKKPSKLFDCMSDKDLIRVKKVRSYDEIAELERERQELIKGQAVKKNPGIAAKWWNPPQQKTLEEELGQDQLESHRRYEERKQKKREASNVQGTFFKHTAFSDMGPKFNKENIVVDKIDFSSARSQFLQRPEDISQSVSPKSLASQLSSAKPQTLDITDVERLDSSTFKDTHDTTTVKTEKICYSLENSEQTRDNSSENEISENNKTWMDDEDFTCVRAVMTIISDEDLGVPTNYPSYIKEHVSGLDDNYLQCQNTTVEETLSNNICKENMSDGERLPVSLESSLTSHSLASSPQIVNSLACLKPQSENFLHTTNCVSVLTEDQLQYYASMLVQNAIKQAVTQLNISWELLELPKQCFSYSEQHAQAEKQSSTLLEKQSKGSSKQEMQNMSPKSTIMTPVSPMDTDSYGVFQPPQQCSTFSKKQEFSYFSKYSEAAELRSTASVTKPQDTGMCSGPFKLRSHKQRTLSMIEEEIRAAQEREEELKRQRKMKTFNSSQKYKENSLPPTYVLTSKTYDKIEMFHALASSSTSSDNPLCSSFTDTASENSGGSQHPKNLETLKDYEINKVKHLEQIEDTRVSIHVKTTMCFQTE
ncbi:A-kinase anchor protein 2 isoform X1 [Arapaima gigas]